MTNDVIHPVEEFGDLPWGELDPEQCTRAWSFGFGGHGLIDSQGTISIIHEDGSADIWVMPDSLSAVIKIARDSAERDAKRKIRLAIGAE